MDNNTKALQLTTHPNGIEQTLVNQTKPGEPQPSRASVIEGYFRQLRYGNSTAVGSWLRQMAKDDSKALEKQL